MNDLDYACRIHILMDSSRIIYLNSILDSYEGLAMMRTADEVKGEIVIYTSSTQLETVKELLESLKNEGVNLNICDIDYIDKVY